MDQISQEIFFKSRARNATLDTNVVINVELLIAVISLITSLTSLIGVLLALKFSPGKYEVLKERVDRNKELINIMLEKGWLK